MEMLRDRNPIVFTIKLIIICNSFSLQALRTFYAIESKDIFLKDFLNFVQACQGSAAIVRVG